MRSSSPKSFRAKPPITEAPRMFAMVLRERMAELVSSIFLVKLSISMPFLRF